MLFNNANRYMSDFNLDEAKIPPLTAPKVEHATKKGISQRKAEPNNLLANVWNRKRNLNLHFICKD